MEDALRSALGLAVAAESRAAAQQQARKPQIVQSEVVRDRQSSGGRTRQGCAPAESDSRRGCATRQHGAGPARVDRRNIPLALGREAIAIGGGGSGGGAHTLQEWFDCNGRELGLKRILLTMLTLSGNRRMKEPDSRF